MHPVNKENKKIEFDLSKMPNEVTKKTSSLPKTFSRSTSTTMLSHIQADFYIAGAPNQEGNSRENSLEAMLCALHTLPPELMTPDLKQLIQEFDCCYALLIEEKKYNSALLMTQRILEDVQKLPVGTRYLFLGGWDATGIGTSAHAMMHAIEKQDNGKYTLMTFNTGGGLPTFHDYQVDRKGYRRYKPVVIYKDIEESHLFLNPTYLLSLIDLRHSPLSKRDAEYGAEMIYDSILPAFGGTAVPASSDLIHVMRAQRSGTCTWKVLKALLMQAVGPARYKGISIHLRLQNLKDYVNEKQQKGIFLTDSEHLHLINDLEKITRELSKEGHGFNFERKEKYFAEISSLRKKMASCISPKGVEFKSPFTGLKAGFNHELGLDSSYNPLKDLTVSTEKSSSRMAISLSTARPAQEKLLPHLEGWVTLCEKLYQNAQYDELILSVNELIRNLPFPGEHLKGKADPDLFWGELADRNEVDITRAMCLLGKLNELLFQSCFRMQQGKGAEIVTAVTTYCMQIKLLETLLHFERSIEGAGILGLYQEFSHQAHSLHINSVIDTQLVVYDLFLNERAAHCSHFIERGGGYTSFIDLLLLRESNNIQYILDRVGDRKALDALGVSIRQKAVEKGVCFELSEEKNLEQKQPWINYSLLTVLLYADLGQFQIAPNFIASLNKQIFITSYFLGNRDFVTRGPGSEKPDAFTLEALSWQEIANMKESSRRGTCSIWVKGVAQESSERIHSVSQVRDNFYKEIVNPEIRTFVKCIIERKTYINPNEALTTYKDYKHLFPKEAQELITLVNTPPEMMLWQTLSFFSKSIDKLQIRDYQLLFEFCVFPYLQEEMKSNPQCVKNFLSFISSGMEEFRAPSQIDAFLFLIRVGMHAEGLIKQDQSHWLKLLRARLRSSQDEAEQRALEAQIAHTLVASSPEVTQENVAAILLGLSHMQLGQIPSSMKEPRVLQPVLEWLHKHEKQIQKMDAQVLCAAVFPLKEIQWSGSFPLHISSCGQYRVNILTGKRFVQHSNLGTLPQTILNNHTFCHLFDSMSERKVRIEDFKCFYFTEKKRDFRIEQLTNGEIAIEQKSGDRWFLYLPLNFVPSELPSSMKESYTHWVSEEGKELLIQDKNFNSCFAATSSEIHPAGRPDITCAHGWVFYKTCFTRFEERDFIQGWLDQSNQVVEIIMPRYGLHFILKDEPNKPPIYASKEFPGYYVAKEQNLPHIPFATSYLILENEKGEKKALLPSETLDAELTNQNFLKPVLSMKPDEPFLYLSIDLSRQGKPKNLTQHQAITLAYLAVAHKNYIEADRFLKIAEGLSSLHTENLIQPFCTFMSLGQDNHPRALALTLRVGMLALNNMRYKYKSSDPSAEQRIKVLLEYLYGVYRKYHKVDANAGHWMLKAHSERSLLQEFFNHHLLRAREFDRLLYLHQGKDLEVTQRKADGLEIGAERAIVTELYEPANWSYFLYLLQKWVPMLNEKTWIGKKSLIDRPLTRPGQDFIPYFLEVCLHVEDYRNDPEKQAELNRYLQFIKWGSPGAFFRDCLLAIVHDQGNHYVEYLQRLQELSKAAAPGNGDLLTWMYQLVKHHRALSELKDTPAPKKPSFPSLPSVQFPEHVSPSFPTFASSSEVQPLCSSAQLELLFEAVPLDAGESLPDISSHGLQKHQERQINIFNKNKNAFYQNAKPKDAHHLRDPKQFESDLIDAISVGKEALNTQKEYLRSLANGSPKDPEKFLAWKLEQEGFQKGQLTIEDLISLYLRGSEAEILRCCPGFENKAKRSELLLRGVKKYLEAATAQQQRKRALKGVQELQTTLAKEPSLDKDKELENINAELYSTLAAVREYDAHSHPDLLVFEYRTDKLLRKEQYDLYKKLTDFKKEPAETEGIEHLTMGAGKTKVVLPLLGSKNADGKKLFFIIVPSFNYQTNRLDLQGTSVGALQQNPLSFHFDRNTPFTEEELRHQLWNLQNAVLYRTYVVTTPENLLCLKLKYDEILYQIGEGEFTVEEVESRMKLLSEILTLIQTAGWAILDEADDILNVRREVNFPLGTYKECPKERTQLIAKIYKVLLSDEMETWTHLKNNKPEAFAIDNFHTKIAPMIVDHLIKDWVSDLIQEEDLKKFLLGQLKENALKGLSEHPQKALISLAKEMLMVFIPSVLQEKGNESFGLSQTTNKKYPIPYVGNNTPDEASEFGNIYKTLLCAAHIYSQGGLQETHIDELIQETCLNIRLESKDQQCAYAETPLFKTFTAIYGVKDPFAITQAERKILAAAVTKDHRALFHWLENFVYPDVRYTLQKINANAMTLIDMLAHAQGFTGTPERPAHERLQKKSPLEEEYSSSESELRILHAIYQKVKEGGIKTLYASSAKESLDRLLEDFQFDCLIDVGALLNGITNQAVAQAIRTRAEKEQVNGVVYFNEKNELVLWLKGEAEPIHFSEEEWGRVISYYDQLHTRGADISQSPTAKARLTFSGKTTMGEFVQGAMRMRKLTSSHNIEIVIPSELRDQMEGTPTFDKLLKCAIICQANRVADDLVISTKMLLHRIIRHELDLLIYSRPQLKDQVKLQKFAKDQRIDVFPDDPYQEFGMCFNLEDTLTVLEEYRSKQMASISELMKEKSLQEWDKPLQEAFLNTAHRVLEKLKAFRMPSAQLFTNKIPRLYMGQVQNNALVEVEKEVEVEVQAETKLVNEQSKNYELWGSQFKPPILDALFFTPQRTDSPKNCPLVESVHSLLQSAIFDEDLYTTRLFSQSVLNQRNPLFGNGSQKHCYQLLFVVEPDGVQRGIIMDPAEISRVRVHMHKDTVQGRKIHLVDLVTGNTLEQRGTLTEKEQEKLAMLQVQTKFFNGELTYTKKEWTYLKEWIGAKGIKPIRDLLEKILSSYLGLSEKYQGSDLRKYLYQSM